MLGHVFQVNGEQRKRGQFKDTIDMLRIYIAKSIQREIDKIGCLFDDDIKTPIVNEPDKPTILPPAKEITKTQTSIYNARIKFFIKEERSLKSALAYFTTSRGVNAIL